jgi:uroporphyrin-III C-methyltransferase
MTAQGHVTLVGAGPGAADLLTYRAWRAIARADVVVHDRLVPLEVLDDLGDRAGAAVEMIDVGKAPGKHKVAQDDINALLVRHARAGKRVVRLKGGDPFVFGRGGEEYAACTAAGVAVDVVPGVSSALAVPALAGVPLTHRGTTTAFHVVTAHTRTGEQELDDVAVACVTQRAATLVILMGVSSLPAIVTRLLDAGASPDTPVAIVERGSTPEQRVTRVVLDLAAKRAGEVGVRAPAVIVVGDVAAQGLLEGVSDRGDVGEPRG